MQSKARQEVRHVIPSPFDGTNQSFQKKFLQLNLPDIKDLLDSQSLCELFEQAEAAIPHSLRERIWTPVTTLFAFVKQKLISHGGAADAVSFVQAEQVRMGQTACSSSSSAYCQARQKLPTGLFWGVMRYCGQQLEEEGQQHWGWRGHPVKLVDGSTVLMSDTEANQAVYPQEPNQKEGLGFPIARIGVMVSLNSAAVLDCRIGPYVGKGTGESALLRQMMPDNFQAGDICLADRYYESFWFEAALLEQSADMLTPVRASRKIKWIEGVQQGNDYYDRLFELKKPARPEWMSLADYQRLPQSITIRIFRIHGRNYATTLLNPRKYRKNALRKLYQQRWHIEVDLRFIKRVMDMEFLHCKTPAMVEKEMAVTLLAYNLIRMLMLQAGIRYGVWPRNLSFNKALSTFREFTGDLLKETGEALALLADKLLKIIADAKLFKRKEKQEPRQIKRRHTKKYPYQNEPRAAKDTEQPKKQTYKNWFRQVFGVRDIHANLT